MFLVYDYFFRCCINNKDLVGIIFMILCKYCSLNFIFDKLYVLMCEI